MTNYYSPYTMNYELTDNQIEELLPAYVLGALEPEEMLVMDEYIDRQRHLLRQVEALEQVVAQMAHVVPSHSMPDHVKGQLMERVRLDLTEGEEVNVRPPSPTTVGAGRPASAPRRTPQLTGSLLTGVQSWFASLRLWQGAAAFALAMLFLTTFYNSQLQSELNEIGNEQAALQGQLSELEQSNQRLQQQLQSNETRLAFFAAAQRIVSLPGTEAAPSARATFYQRGSEGLLVWNGLEPASNEQSYQVWLIPSEGNPVPAGLLDASTDATHAASIPVPTGAENYAAVGVSLEPRGGSPQPTGPILLLGQSAPGS